MAYSERKLSWRENAMSTERFSMPEFDGSILSYVGSRVHQGAQATFNSKQPQRQHFLYSFPSTDTLVGIVPNLLITLRSLISIHLQYSPALSGNSSLHLKGESYIFELHTPMAKDRLCFSQQPSRLCHARSRKQQLSTNLPIFAFPGHEGLEPTSSLQTLTNATSSRDDTTPEVDSINVALTSMASRSRTIDFGASSETSRPSQGGGVWNGGTDNTAFFWRENLPYSPKHIRR